MPALLGVSWFAIAGFGLAGLLGGCVLRHLWGVHADRANANRISVLCDQLDAKDGKLQSLRAELQAEQQRVHELKSKLAAHRAVGNRPTGSFDRVL